MTSIKKISLVTIITALLLAGGLFYYGANNKGPVDDFDYDRDAQQLLEMFDKDWYWLFASTREEFSPVFSLKFLTPTQDRAYFGSLKIKLIRENDQVLGFVAYYMNSAHEGQLLWLDVKEEARGRGYGHLLAQLAVDQMIEMGAHKIGMWTRVSNLNAQRIYKKIGFKEAFDTPDGYIYFEYTKN